MRISLPKSVLIATGALLVATAVVFASYQLDEYDYLRLGFYGAAAKRFENAAAAGNHDAQNTLGTLFYHGLGVPQDYRQAKHWYAMAAYAGHTSAQINMGILYRQGFGVDVNLERAYAWFHMAHRAGSPLGQLYMSDTLAETALNGNIVPQILRRYGSLQALRQ